MKLNVKDFYFDLPEELIALSPEKKRDNCKLLILTKDKKSMKKDFFFNLLDYLKKDDLLVFNDIKVDKARILGKRLSGGKHEVLLISSTDLVRWKAMTSKTSRLKIGEILYFENNTEAEILEKTEDGKIIIFFNKKIDDTILNDIGKVPLPPYIQNKREYKKEDEQYYQTVYSKNGGAKAAPTAGLHFTDELIKNIKKSGI